MPLTIPERSLTTEEVAALFYVCETTVRRWIADGRMPAVKVGQQWRIRPEHVRELLGIPA
jgi:excisionase family DNA binding protein